MKPNHFSDLYEEYDFMDNGRSAHRKQRPAKPAPTNRKTKVMEAIDIHDMDDRIENFIPTYVRNLDPQHHERQWVINSLQRFYENNQITDVLRLVKGGKEANVYCCEANPATGLDLIAAKLYRPRMLRTLKNDAIYKEGRVLRGDDGKTIRGSRELRALSKKTAFGQKLDLLTWIEHEYQTQIRLFKVGVKVPKPIAHGDNAILMAFIGDEESTAPTLSDVRLTLAETKRIFDQVWHNVCLMLANHCIHGDLSAYNILYWEGEIAIIDFPQVADARKNPHAPDLLTRDIRRLCEYFERMGVCADWLTMSNDLWQRYLDAKL